MNRLVTRSVLGAACWLAGCAAPVDAPPVPAENGLERRLLFLVQRAEEQAYKLQFDPREPPDGRALLGPDPTRIVALPDGGFVTVLTRPGQVALLDADLRELDRVFALPRATALSVDQHGTIWVGSPTQRQLVALRVAGQRLERVQVLDMQQFASIGVRSVASGGGCFYGVDEHAKELAYACGAMATRLPLQPRPVDVALSAHFLVVTSAVGHALTVLPLAAGEPDLGAEIRIENDGPFFGAAIHERADGSLVVASGGIEDHPLDRRGGSFGYIDSYVFVDVVERGVARRAALVDVGELGLITPKALAIRETATGVRVHVTSYGSSAAATLDVPLAGGLPVVTRVVGAPGVSSLAVDRDGGLVAASPLLDGVLRLGSSAPHLTALAETVPPPVDARLPAGSVLRLGEALFYTNAMGPFQSSAGELSRFSCESCHFEGGIDGRVHQTGRGDVAVTTKPLFGLGNNGPHFTRALDDDLTEMVFAEFRVAAANSGHSDWFDLAEANIDWLPMSEARGAGNGPAELRRALVLYLASLPHEPNPRTLGRQHLSSLERRGAALFDAHCESCHEARLASNDPASRVPFDEWESLVLAPTAPLVWARDGYEKTGVTPYVHEDGARPSSLRRIAEKTPYFTNGSSRGLIEVVRRARRQESDTFLHDGAGEPIFDEAEATALVAFLSLL